MSRVAITTIERGAARHVPPEFKADCKTVVSYLVTNDYRHGRVFSLPSGVMPYRFRDYSGFSGGSGANGSSGASGGNRKEMS
jgi:hypothetical protein